MFMYLILIDQGWHSNAVYFCTVIQIKLLFQLVCKRQAAILQFGYAATNPFNKVNIILQNILSIQGQFQGQN